MKTNRFGRHLFWVGSPSRLIALTLISSLASAGCSSSVEVRDFKPAQGPAGVHMELTLNGDVIDGNKVSGELLAVRDDGLILNAENYASAGRKARTVVLIPFWMMHRAKLEQMGTTNVESKGKEQTEAYLDKLRLVARFPQGLSDELMTALLREMKQETLEVPSRVD